MNTKDLIRLGVPVGEPIQLAAAGVELLSAGLDGVPGVYKDIAQVMAAETDLAEVLGRFDPKLVKMCPPGERAEN